MKIKMSSHVQEAHVDLTPMIDTVMILLIFFMVTTNLHRQEADVSFALPGVAAQEEAVEIPDEQIIEIHSDGNVMLNDLVYDKPGESDMPQLVETLVRFRQSAEASRVQAMITVDPDVNVIHQRVVDVLNACASARISNVTFAVEEE